MSSSRARRRPVLLTGVLASLLVFQRGVASPTSANPDEFESIRVVLAAGDFYELSCSESSRGSTSATFIALSETGPTGSLNGGGMSAGTSSSGFYFQAKLGPLPQVEHVLIEGHPGGGNGSSTAMGMASQDGSILRAAWAGWSADLECLLTVNGEAIPPVTQPTARAVYLTAADLEGGAGLDSRQADAAFLQSVERAADGYLMALLAAEFGETLVSGPEGQSFHETGNFPFISISESTQGIWRYSARLGVQHVGLWVLELPN